MLVAADSAVMMIDAAKGVEAQTIKLFKVCRLRNIPIFTFVNKMDRAAKDPFSLMEEIEQVLGIRACPINWPIGTDGDFKGVYHRDTRMVELYESGDHGKTRVEKMDVPVDDPSLPELLGERLYTRLMDEIEKELGIGTYPMNWPIGSGVDFKGVYDREKSEILAFEGDKELRGQHEVKAHEIDLNDAALETILGESLCQTLRDDVELLDGAGYEFDLEKVRHGKLSPVFFGSALTNFGVEPFLESFLRMTTSPLPRQTSEGVVDPFSKDFSAFVFKIQANMNKAHRDRIAFMRICIGKFEKGMEVTHVQGGRKIKLSQPQQMMAQSREIIDEAYAGDIIGVFDPGIFSIGDTICTGKKVQFEGIPTFAPEFFCRVQQKDTMKRKQFVKGTTQIAQEGAIQIFQEIASGMEEVIVGVVGTLQFDVFKYRMENEYNVEIRMETLPYSLIRWIDTPDVDLKKLNLTSDTKKVQDIRGRYLLLFSNEWSIRWALEHNEGLELSEFSR